MLFYENDLKYLVQCFLSGGLLQLCGCQGVHRKTAGKLSLTECMKSSKQTENTTFSHISAKNYSKKCIKANDE